MVEACTVTLDKHRAKRYFMILSGASLVGSWTIWFVMGFMGSNATAEGVTMADLLRTTVYSLPIGILLALVFPLMIRAERQKKWIVSLERIEVYERGELVLSCLWKDLEDIIFREYSVGIMLSDATPNEYNIALPSETVCSELSELYNRAKGTYCRMDSDTPSK